MINLFSSWVTALLKTRIWGVLHEKPVAVLEGSSQSTVEGMRNAAPWQVQAWGQLLTCHHGWDQHWLQCFLYKKMGGQKDIFIFLLCNTALEKLISDPTDFIPHLLPSFLKSLVKMGQKGRKVIQKYCLLKTASDRSDQHLTIAF